jgi:hypothetical protein
VRSLYAHYDALSFSGRKTSIRTFDLNIPFIYIFLFLQNERAISHNFTTFIDPSNSVRAPAFLGCFRVCGRIWGFAGAISFFEKFIVLHTRLPPASSLQPRILARSCTSCVTDHALE